jgi:hypothetical protein
MACLRHACASGGCGRAGAALLGAPKTEGSPPETGWAAAGFADHRARRVQAEREAARVPAGMRALPEAERLEMLDALGRARADLEAQIQARLTLTLTLV